MCVGFDFATFNGPMDKNKLTKKAEVSKVANHQIFYATDFGLLSTSGEFNALLNSQSISDFLIFTIMRK